MSSVIESSAAPRRPRLITPQGVAAVAFTVAASLALLFPGLDFGHPAFLAHPDELSIAYLHQVLQQRPQDRAARLLLARQQLALGKWSEAEANLRRLLREGPAGEDALSSRARLVLVELERASVDALPATDAGRRPRQADAVAHLHRLASAPLESAELDRAAELALALESPADAAAIYERLARDNPRGRRDWARLAGRWYQAAGRLQQSATAYQMASDAAPSAADGVADALRAVDVLRAANDGAAALAAVDRALGRWPAEPRLLDKGVTVALAEGRVSEAQRWGARLVAAFGDEESIVRRQIDVDVAAGDTPAALSLALALADRRPDDLALRRRVAELATWSGQPRVALAAWAWLAARGFPGARDQALDLGRALFDHQTVASLLEASARRGDLKLDDLLELADALEAQGNPDGARATLRRFERPFTGERRYWIERAAVDERAGDLEGALFSVRTVDRLFAGASESGHEAELLWSLDRPDEALAVARRQAQTADPAAVPFWRMFGDLAWTTEADADARSAYQHVWTAGGGDGEVAERLATLLVDAGQIDELARLAADAYQKLGASSVLLEGMEAAADAERWEPARRLASIAAPHRDQFEDEAGYWSVLARLAEQDGDRPQAVAAFARAVALAPADTGLAEDLHEARVEAGLESDPQDADDARAAAAERASARLGAAIDGHDRKAVREILAADGGLLTVSERIDAERELGRDDRAWALLAHAPLHSGDPEEDASLALHRQELSEDRLSGAYAGAAFEDLSSLGIFGQWGRAEVRRGQVAIEAVAEHDRLDSALGSTIGAVHADEAKAGLAFSAQEAQGDTRVEAGAYAFSTGAVPYASAVQGFEPLHGLTIGLEGLYNQRPTETPVLRAAGLKDSAELEIAWSFADRFRVTAAGGGNRYLDRGGALVTSGGVGRLELSALLRKAAPLVRARLDGFVEANRSVSTVPAGLATAMAPGTAIGDVVPDTYGTVGVGVSVLGLSDDDDDFGSGRVGGACHICLRPLADLWAGWLIPAQTMTYSLDGGLGYLFARHQELAATGFYHNDQGGHVGQQYTGVSLRYTLRWL